MKEVRSMISMLAKQRAALLVAKYHRTEKNPELDEEEYYKAEIISKQVNAILWTIGELTYWDTV